MKLEPSFVEYRPEASVMTQDYSGMICPLIISFSHFVQVFKSLLL